ncbi:MAG: hypothetical protein KY393_02535, partial [Actinobacteria bacterium]|nr:hypothetical protein [Actinomycetota bacterium]
HHQQLQSRQPLQLGRQHLLPEVRQLRHAQRIALVMHLRWLLRLLQSQGALSHQLEDDRQMQEMGCVLDCKTAAVLQSPHLYLYRQAHALEKG